MKLGSNRCPAFIFLGGTMLEQLSKAYNYYKTIFELASLSDSDLHELGLSRAEIVFVAYRATMVQHD